MSAQRYCKSIGGNLPVLRQWENMYHINDIAKPWPVYIGVMQVNYDISSSGAKYSGENNVDRRLQGTVQGVQQSIKVEYRGVK